MKNELGILEISEILLRFLSRPKYYFGDVIIKFQGEKIKNIISNDSFDMKYLNEKTLNTEENKMFTKFGTATTKDEDSSKIISELKVDEEKNIVKESKIKKENAEDKKD